MKSHNPTIIRSSWKQKLLQFAGMLLMVCHGLTLFAQVQGNNNGNNSTSSVVSSSKSFTMEAVIVTVLIVLALAAICKAVRRS